MKILITGATGLVGKQLAKTLQADAHTVVAVSRDAVKARRVSDEIIVWRHPEVEPFPVAALTEVEVVIHLAGEHIAAARWTDEQKKRIRDSRVLSTKNLVAAMAEAEFKPKTFICASATGFYGNHGDEELTENSPAGTGFLADVCKEWEAAAAHANQFGIRTVNVRIGIVLAKESGALKEMMPIFKLGLGGVLGSGKQWFPWIHIDDVVGIISHSIFTPEIKGAINAVAPNVVTNKEFTSAFASALHRPAIFFVPKFALQFGLGEMSDALLSSQRVNPRVATDTKYRFEFTKLSEALNDLLVGDKV